MKVFMYIRIRDVLRKGAKVLAKHTWTYTVPCDWIASPFTRTVPKLRPVPVAVWASVCTEEMISIAMVEPPLAVVGSSISFIPSDEIHVPVGRICHHFLLLSM